MTGIALFGLVMVLGFMVGGLALFGALAHSWLKDRGPSVSGALWWGLGLGVAFTGAAELGSSLTSSGPPGWPSYSNAVSYLPWLSAGAGPLMENTPLMLQNSCPYPLPPELDFLIYLISCQSALYDNYLDRLSIRPFGNFGPCTTYNIYS